MEQDFRQQSRACWCWPLLIEAAVTPGLKKLVLYTHLSGYCLFIYKMKVLHWLISDVLPKSHTVLFHESKVGLSLLVEVIHGRLYM